MCSCTVIAPYTGEKLPASTEEIITEKEPLAADATDIIAVTENDISVEDIIFFEDSFCSALFTFKDMEFSSYPPLVSEDVFKICMDADFEISIKDMTMSFAEEISILEPFGIGNVTPTFVMKNAVVKRVTHIGGGKHTRLLLEKDGECITALYFGVGEGELGFEIGDPVDVLFNIDINDYKNVRSVQME